MKAGIIGLFLAASLASTQEATVSVNPGHVVNRISAYMYTAFDEFMDEGVKGGLTAEMLHDRAFDQPPDYQGLPAHWRLEPDERDDNFGTIKFAPTTDEAYPKTNSATGLPNDSLRVTLSPDDRECTRRGFSQGRLSIQAGKLYNGYLWIKDPTQNGYTGDISILLEEDNTDGATYAQTSIHVTPGDWSKYSFQLRPNKTDRFAKLTFLFSNDGMLYLDQVSLEPADAVDGLRADTLAMIDGLHPSFLRWPGGSVAQIYHWKWGIGPRDTRPEWVNTQWSNAPELNDFGTDEYLALCARLHIQPSITVNINGSGATPQEAADWVEYVNGPVTSKYGALRAANGHPAPYGVKQWELGNELFGARVKGHTDAATYAQYVLQYAAAMRAVDPSIQLIAVGAGDKWNEEVLLTDAKVINYLAIHNYNFASHNASAPDPRARMMAHAEELEANYRKIGEMIDKLAPDSGIKQVVNEWNLFYPAAVIESMDGAVYCARMMNGFERDGDIIEQNAISDLINGWVGGVIQTTRDRIYGTPEYYAVKMYSDHLGTERLEAHVTSPQLAPSVDSIDAIVTRDPATGTVFVKMSNAYKDKPVQVNLNLGRLRYVSNVQELVLSGTRFDERNTFREPHAVEPVIHRLQCVHMCRVHLPPDSVAVLTIHPQTKK